MAKTMAKTMAKPTAVAQQHTNLSIPSTAPTRFLNFSAAQSSAALWTRIRCDLSGLGFNFVATAVPS